MNKRLLVLLLSLALLLAFLSGCGIVDSESDNTLSSATSDLQETASETENGAAANEPEKGNETIGIKGTTEKPASTTAKPTSTTATAAVTSEPDYVPFMMSAVKKPEPGDDPEKLSGTENVMRIAYVLQHAENYSVDGTGTVNAKSVGINTKQDVKVYKDYSLGVLIQIDITDSSYVSSASQTCYVDGKAMRREASGGKSSWNGRQTAWNTGTPSIFKSLSDYRSSYGLFGYELTNYLLNESTVTEATAVTKNSDGTYTQTIYPNASAATADCAKKMKTVGGLNSEPSFSSIAVKLTFDRNWKILSMHVDETYQAVKKVSLFPVTTNCTASTDYTYSYGKANVADYQSFFAKYAK